MALQKRTKAVGYTHVATENEPGNPRQEQTHRHTLTAYCDKNRLSLTYRFVDIGMPREGRAAALDLLCAGQASVLVMPALHHLSRSTADVLAILDRYFGAEPIGGLIAVAEGLDTRTVPGRMVLDVFRCVARLQIQARGAHA